MKKDCATCEYEDLDFHKEPCMECMNGGTYAKYEPKEGNDPVSHPNHYQSKSGLEVIDVIKAFTEDMNGMESYYTGNILKYMCRWKKKNGLEDLKKARQYLDWLIEMETHPHRSGSKPFSETTKENIKRELNRIYGVPHEEATRIKIESMMDELKDLWKSLSESEKEQIKELTDNKERKEPPKNGRYSMSDDDCFVPWNLKPHMAPSYTYPQPAPCCCGSKECVNEDPELNRPKDIIEIVWLEFCRVFCETLKEVSEEVKETQSVIDRLNQSQVYQTNSLINETILKEKENKKDEK